jgi:hypothetical protein
MGCNLALSIVGKFDGAWKGESMGSTDFVLVIQFPITFVAQVELGQGSIYIDLSEPIQDNIILPKHYFQ